MKFGFSEEDWNEMMRVFKNHPDVHEVILFGSRAMGNFKPGSDVDLALRGNINFSLAANVKGELEEETSLPYFFDVVDYTSIENPDFRDHIDRRGISIYKASSN